MCLLDNKGVRHYYDIEIGPIVIPTWYRSADQMGKKSPHAVFPTLSMNIQSTATSTLIELAEMIPFITLLNV